MSEVEGSVAQDPRDDQIDLTHQETQSVASKRKAGRPSTDAWATFKKLPNPNPGRSKRNWIGVCQFCDWKISSGKVEAYCKLQTGNS